MILRRFVIAALLFPLAAGGGVHAQNPASKARLVVGYVESPTVQARGLATRLRAFVAKSRATAGGPKIETFVEIGRPNRMVVLEHWDNLDPAGDARVGAALQAAAGGVEAPIDRRPFFPATPFLAPAAAGAFHMIMHVDVLPDGAPTALAALKAQKGYVTSAPGGLGFEFAVQTDRSNHFAVHEIWASRAAYAAYVATEQGQELRRKLVPYKGAPFDDRFYTAL